LPLENSIFSNGELTPATDSADVMGWTVAERRNFLRTLIPRSGRALTLG